MPLEVPIQLRTFQFSVINNTYKVPCKLLRWADTITTLYRFLKFIMAAIQNLNFILWMKCGYFCFMKHELKGDLLMFGNVAVSVSWNTNWKVTYSCLNSTITLRFQVSLNKQLGNVKYKTNESLRGHNSHNSIMEQCIENSLDAIKKRTVPLLEERKRSV